MPKEGAEEFITVNWGKYSLLTMKLMFRRIPTMFLESSISIQPVVTLWLTTKKLYQKPIFFTKYLEWQTIDEFGYVSQPYISSASMNAKVYLNECIIKRLIPIIDQHHSRDKVIFWLDMGNVSLRYRSYSVLRVWGIDFVRKEKNAPNVGTPSCIEMFWSLCKRQYKKGSEKPKS